MMRSKKGSVIVFVMLFFVSLMTLLGVFIDLSKRAGAGGATRSLGNLWCESILAEYDLPLQQRYQIFGFYGSPRITEKRLQYYATSSFDGKPYISFDGCSVQLDPYCLSSVDRMERQMVHVGKLIAMKKLVTNVHGGSDGSKGDSLEVKNRISPKPVVEKSGVLDSDVVASSLPSAGAASGFSLGSVKDGFSSLSSMRDLVKEGTDEYFLDRYLFTYFRDYRSDRRLTPCYFNNELEYVICGRLNDDANFRGVRRRVVAAREAVNLAYVLKDPKMNEETLATAQLLTPGPAAVAVQKLLQAGWALAESNNDWNLLISGKKVPLMKDADSWAIDLQSIIEYKGKTKVKTKDGEEERIDYSLKESVPCIDPGNTHGEEYEDYLRFLIMLVPKDTRILRMMDLMEINLRYGWYADFSFRDHFDGLEATFQVNGQPYTMKREYQPEKAGDES